jgi:hypothetical protein
MPNDFSDLETWAKETGTSVPTPKKPAPSAAPKTIPSRAPAPVPPSGTSDLDKWAKETGTTIPTSTTEAEETPLPTGQAIRRGLRRGMAYGGTTLPSKLAQTFFPNLSQATATIAGQIPGVSDKWSQLQQFAQGHSASFPEKIAEGVGETLPATIAMGPAGGIATRIGESILGRVLPEQALRLGLDVSGGRAIGATTAGAAGGAMADPEHPVQGALAGAAGGWVPGVGRAVARSELGQKAAEFAIPALVSHLLGHGGLESVAWGGGVHWLVHNPESPLHGALHQVGPWVFNRVGDLIGIFKPAAAGAVAGKAARSYAPRPSEEE